MNTKLTLASLTLGLLASLHPATAQLTIPSDGSDGVLTITTNKVIDLSEAAPAVWNANNNTNAGKGVYDRDKWAIVFKYQSVNIPAGVVVTFLNHPSRAPVVWLVQGDVIIDGTVNLNGKPGRTGSDALLPVEGGPGGFRGGASGPDGQGYGLGPGGGTSQYATLYGNPQIVPLIGGSGSYPSAPFSAASGGGAILIAATGSVQVDGSVLARGGRVANTLGSGGAVRIIANSITGSGEINCLAVDAQPGQSIGRIRLETPSLAPSLRTFPDTIAVRPASPPTIWPPGNAPTVRIVSVDAANAPADPTAPLATVADIAIENDSPVDILLETRNFPIEGAVEVRIAPKFGWAGFPFGPRAQRVSGDQNLATWKVTTTLTKGFTTLQARATAP